MFSSVGSLYHARNFSRIKFTQDGTEKTMWFSIAVFSSSSKFIQGKQGNFISHSRIISSASSRCWTSVDNAISVINAVFPAPIEPYTTVTTPRSLINPRLRFSPWYNSEYPILIAILFSSHMPKITSSHGGVKSITAHKSKNSLYNCRYRLTKSNDTTK